MLTDSFGALLAAYPITTDYWQGDEAKFIAPIKLAGVYISDSKWDESSKVYSFFVSIPISLDGEFLGVLISGLDVSSEYIMDMSLQDLLQLDVNNLEIH